MVKVKRIARPKPPEPKAEPAPATDFAIVAMGPDGRGSWRKMPNGQYGYLDERP